MPERESVEKVESGYIMELRSIIAFCFARGTVDAVKAVILSTASIIAFCFANVDLPESKSYDKQACQRLLFRQSPLSYLIG